MKRDEIIANKYIGGIDIGTTGAKVGIFDLNGNVISSVYSEHACTYPKPNWVEQDIESTLLSCKKE